MLDSGKLKLLVSWKLLMKILIALDDSVYSKEMLHKICRRHWAIDTQFKIVSVIEPFDFNFEQDEEALKIEIRARRRKYFEKVCIESREFLEKHVAGAIVHFEIREGKPSTEIVMAATEWDADKILIGAHGHAICPHNILGSVSRSVAERAMCTVEVVRTGSPLVSPALSKLNAASQV